MSVRVRSLRGISHVTCIGEMHIPVHTGALVEVLHCPQDRGVQWHHPCALAFRGVHVSA